LRRGLARSRWRSDAARIRTSSSKEDTQRVRACHTMCRSMVEPTMQPRTWPANSTTPDSCARMFDVVLINTSAISPEAVLGRSSSIPAGVLAQERGHQPVCPSLWNDRLRGVQKPSFLINLHLIFLLRRTTRAQVCCAGRARLRSVSPRFTSCNDLATLAVLA
jgi:hypothetical protein